MRSDRTVHDVDEVKDLLYRAWLLPASVRRQFLAGAGSGPAVRGEVESLFEFSRTEGARSHRLGGSGRALRLPDRPNYRPGMVVAGRYRIERLLGVGGMGVVYAVHDLVLDLQVALKTLRIDGAMNRGRLIDEVRLARRITHPAVCRVHDVGTDGATPFFTMELIEGDDLETLLDRHGRFPASEVARVGASIAGGLAAAHAAGVLHRDLKPANILIDHLGAVHVTDFGISSVSGEGGDRSDLAAGAAERFGTPTYMAPEEIDQHRRPSVGGDLYSLGVVLYEMLTGDPPYDATDPQVLEDQHRLGCIEPPSQRAPDVDPRLQACVLRLLAAPEGRPTSAAGVAREIASIANERIPWASSRPSSSAHSFWCSPSARPC